MTAAPAHAAKARILGACAGSYCGWVMDYRADPGERNVFTTARDWPHALILRDTGATISGCPSVEGGVRCSDPEGYAPSSLTVYLGDGDDQANTSVAEEIHGGPGNDALTGSTVFYDDDGDVRGRDVYTGAKELRYHPRKRAVRLDLRPGHPSEDRVTGVAAIWGTRAADVLTGDDGPNTFHGEGGDDLVRGLGGDDVLSGNRVDGGPGDDTIFGGHLGARVRCGTGTDTVLPNERGLIDPDCEFVQIDDETKRRARLHLTVRRAGAAVLGRLVCGSAECPDRWRLKVGGRIVGEATVGRRPAALRLRAAGWELLQRRRTLPVQVERRRKVAGYDLYETDGFRIELRRP